jgi:hypothetical protein
MFSFQDTVPLLTYTPVPRVTRARIYRTAADRWMVLIRDIAYDGAPRRKYVSQRDFDMLVDAEAFALRETGSPAKISL